MFVLPKRRRHRHGKETGKRRGQHPQAKRRALGRTVHCWVRRENRQMNHQECPRQDTGRSERKAGKGSRRSGNRRCTESRRVHARHMAANVVQAIRQAASAILDCGILPARYRAAHHATHRRYSAEKIVWTRPAMALLGSTISTLFTGYQSHIENQSMCKPCKILR